ncbi:MAG: DUF1704 domain-containing protein [Rhodobacteraceae bacterium]|nr:DUF1704 domain-containing protein [Paracoccaceae bacterium]
MDDAPSPETATPKTAEHLSPAEVERLQGAAAALRKAEKPVRILRAVGWGPEVEAKFMAAKARELPDVSYTPLDAAPVHAALADIKPLVNGSSPVHAWLGRVIDAVGTAADMLAGIGTPAFHRHSLALYGSPQTQLMNCDVRPFDLARMLDTTLGAYSNLELNLNATQDTPHISAAEMQPRMQAILDRHFEGGAPSVEIADHLSAKALAGSKYIRLKRTASFSDRDLAQLVHHEAFVHAGTSYNGAAQASFPILAAGHAGTTRTQEGLAVFAELISGAMDPSRMLRLADRVLAIQMAMDGADFIQLYEFFLQRHDDPHHAFENARRVVRGGVLKGGAPFTKDSVYLEGVVRVHNFLRIAVQETRVDCIRLLFAGKLDIEDMPAITMLAAQGLIKSPKFLPPWAKDLRFLLSYIAYSSFLNRMQLDRVRDHYIDMLRACVPAGT